ncbi:MAG: hypothetical protein R2726_14210 [Acidimicrobiales bacterium]
MQFSPDLRDRAADGTITVSYRLWSRPKVKVGGVYRSGSVAIVVDDLELLPFSTVSDDDLARTGEPDLETLRRRAAHAGPIDDDTLVYRVQFHVVGPSDTSGDTRPTVLLPRGPARHPVADRQVVVAAPADSTCRPLSLSSAPPGEGGELVHGAQPVVRGPSATARTRRR